MKYEKLCLLLTLIHHTMEPRSFTAAAEDLDDLVKLKRAYWKTLVIARRAFDGELPRSESVAMSNRLTDGGGYHEGCCAVSVDITDGVIQRFWVRGYSEMSPLPNYRCGDSVQWPDPHHETEWEIHYDARPNRFYPDDPPVLIAWAKDGERLRRLNTLIEIMEWD